MYLRCQRYLRYRDCLRFRGYHLCLHCRGYLRYRGCLRFRGYHLCRGYQRYRLCLHFRGSPKLHQFLSSQPRRDHLHYRECRGHLRHQPLQCPPYRESPESPQRRGW